MRILITGVGDAFTTKHFSTSALVEGPEGYVLIDCPDLVHRVLHEATSAVEWAVGVAGIHDIVLTHLHGDHCNGLESFGFYRRVMRHDHPETIVPRLHTVKAVADRLWERLAPAMDGPFADERPSTLADYFDVRIMEPDGATAHDVAGLSVRCRPTKHPIPTIGLLLRDDGGDDRAPATLAWSGDTPFEPEHVAWLSAGDVIVHESNLGPAHTTIDALEALPEMLRGKLRLIHLPDEFEADATDLAVLREGQLIEFD